MVRPGANVFAVLFSTQLLVCACGKGAGDDDAADHEPDGNAASSDAATDGPPESTVGDSNPQATDSASGSAPGAEPDDASADDPPGTPSGSGASGADTDGMSEGPGDVNLPPDDGSATDDPADTADDDTADDDTGSDDAGNDDATDDGVAETDSVPPEDPIAPPGSVPVFVAGGAGGHRITSCDDGRTWLAEHVDEPDYGDYDHHQSLIRGLAYGAGVFLSFHGWGFDGQVRRSSDGVNWEDSFPQGEQVYASGFWDATFGDGVFLGVGSAAFIRTTDGGVSWDDWGWLEVEDGHTLVAYGDDTFVTVQPGQVVRSEDGAASWQAPIAFDCPAEQLVYGNGVFLTHGTNGDTCRSVDAGRTWEAGNNTQVGGEAGTILWTGEEFLAFGSGTSRSADGLEWTPGSATGLGLSIGASVNTQSGTIVATGLSPTRLARSEDGGRTWETTFEGDPFFRKVAFGFVSPSAQCPSR